MKPAWGLNKYSIEKGENGYVISAEDKPGHERLQVFLNLRAVFIWLCREFLAVELMKELAFKRYLKKKTKGLQKENK